MKRTAHIGISLLLVLTLVFGALGFAAPEANGLEDTSFEYSMNMLRVAKNGFYNSAEAALAEDGSFAQYLYLLFDYVYGDSALDTFANCMLSRHLFEQAVTHCGYDICAAATDEKTHAAAVAGGASGSAVFIADYSPETGLAVLRRVAGGRQTVYSWRRVEGGFVIQYLAPEQTGSLYHGYRAYLNDDGTGRVLCGLRCTEAAMRAFTEPSAGGGLVSQLVFGYDTIELGQETITVTPWGGEPLVHTIGDIPVQETDDPGDDPGDDTGGEPEDGGEP